METATGDRKSSESEKHFIAHLNGRALGFSQTQWENHITGLYTGSLQQGNGVEVIFCI